MSAETPRHPHRIGVLLAVAGALAVAFAAWGLATTPTPAEGLDDEASAGDVNDALERFRLRLDRQAQLQAVGFVLITAGILVGIAPPRPLRTLGRDDLLLALGLGGSLLIGVARWMSLEARQFAPDWDRWVGVEGAGWAIWAGAFALIALKTASPATPARPPDRGEKERGREGR